VKASDIMAKRRIEETQEQKQIINTIAERIESCKTKERLKSIIDAN
jgi:hypothetical protein